RRLREQKTTIRLRSRQQTVPSGGGPSGRLLSSIRTELFLSVRALAIRVPVRNGTFLAISVAAVLWFSAIRCGTTESFLSGNDAVWIPAVPRPGSPIRRSDANCIPLCERLRLVAHASLAVVTHHIVVDVDFFRHSPRRTNASERQPLFRRDIANGNGAGRPHASDIVEGGGSRRSYPQGLPGLRRTGRGRICAIRTDPSICDAWIARYGASRRRCRHGEAEAVAAGDGRGAGRSGHACRSGRAGNG